MSQFKIKFRGLKEGTYNFKFNINDAFFKKYPESEIKKAKVLAEVEMLITKELLKFNIHLSGTAELQCDRCLDFFNSPVNYETVLFAYFGYTNSDLSEADNRITISNKMSEMVLDKHFYDYLHLSIPYQKIHPNDKKGNSTCNKEMIKKIKEYSTGIETEITDSRWDKLKSLYN